MKIGNAIIEADEEYRRGNPDFCRCSSSVFIIGWCDCRKHYSTANNLTNSNRSVSE